MEPDRLSLQFKKSMAKDNGTCYAVTWHGDELIIGVKNGVLVCNTVSGEVNKIKVGCAVMSVKPAGTFALATLCKQSDQEREIRISNPISLPNQRSVFLKFEQNNKTLAHLSVSETHVAVVDKQLERVTVFNRKGEHVIYIGAGQLHYPGAILLDKNYIFVCDGIYNCCYKYNLQEPSEPVWECNDLTGPSGICQDKDGCLYVVSFDKKQIYLVSPKGRTKL